MLRKPQISTMVSNKLPCLIHSFEGWMAGDGGLLSVIIWNEILPVLSSISVN